MNTMVLYFSLILSFVITSYLIYKYAYPNDKLTCNHYILNSYLYILLSLIFMVLFVFFLSRNFPPGLSFIYNHSFMNFIIKIIALVAILMFTLKTDPRHFVLKHFYWLLLILGLSIIMLPIYEISSLRGIFISTIFTTFIMVALISAIAFFRPDLISLSWGPILFSLLLIAIVMRISMLFFIKYTPQISIWTRILSYAIVVLFTFILLYDTKKLQGNAKHCSIPDYVNESINIFLDVINIFANLARGRIR